MTRTKKYAAAAAVAAVLVGVPTGAYATHATHATENAPAAHPAPQLPRQAPQPHTHQAQQAQQTRPTTPSVRIIQPGERIDARDGWTLWLTREGKHWAGPDGYENFRSVVDGNIDLSRPGVSHQSQGDATGVFHSGVYYGTKKAARVELVAADGTRARAALVELPGKPGWGAWYVSTPPATDPGGLGVALYDRTGKLIAELPAFPV
ncbi:hypothetical protein [Streptomyces thermolilacinus]|uniref:Uncharacterized protein n=1 Tax=Streptomyces thermolilacinus SPC6 TaxID=1306406 RepID=A0A1D3DRN5_9ACTN|nr:hypothetical protein [Streptomyces thermolilacinus]OEJ94989.1 hypothetical protein J116_011310 [Streptomyces thermolilacinus SPC6]